MRAGGAYRLHDAMLGRLLELAGEDTTVLVVSFFSGVQLLALGVVGEYIGRIYDETKRRPMYIVDRKINFSDPAGQIDDQV